MPRIERGAARTPREPEAIPEAPKTLPVNLRQNPSPFRLSVIFG